MQSKLTELCPDYRLERILGESDQPCAVELWILQLRVDDTVSSRLAYGRVVPTDFKNNVWNAQREDTFRPVDELLHFQVKRVSIFANSQKVRVLLGRLVEGKSLGVASADAQLTFSENARRFEGLVLGDQPVLRPVMHLPARDHFQFKSNKLSVTSLSSMDSAAISGLQKYALFTINNPSEPDLAKAVIEVMNAETGLDFANLDAWRLGDLELGTFPALSDNERPIVSIQTQFKSDPPGVIVAIDGPLAPQGYDLEVELQIFNDGALIHVDRTVLRATDLLPQKVSLTVPPSYSEMVDALTVHIDARGPASSLQRRFQWGAYLVREIGTQMNVIGNVTRIKFDWLSIALRRSHQPRLKAVQDVPRLNHSHRNVIGGREHDAWVPANRQMVQLMSNLIPRVSGAKWFERYAEGENTGRLELVEWLKTIFETNQDKHIAWFDPYMEDVGVHLINQYGFSNGNYVIFTHAQDFQLIETWYDHLVHWNEHGDPEDQPNTGVGTRTSRLVEACRGWQQHMGGIRLRVIGLPEDTLHDRMIVIRDASMAPVAGYHLSNSIQKANENYPLLVTPIPPDILRNVCAYADKTLQSVVEASSKSQGSDNLEPMVIFDSDAERPRLRDIEQPDVFSMPLAGLAFSWWTVDSSLAGLAGAELKAELRERTFLNEDDRLNAEVFDHIPERFWSEGHLVEGFNGWWDAVATVMAHTPAGDHLTDLLVHPVNANPALSTLLISLLDPDREDAIQPLNLGPLADIMEQLQKSHVDLLRSGSAPQRMFRESRTTLSWSDRFAIDVLWYFDPSSLVQWMEIQASQTDRTNRRRQLTLRHAMSKISLASGFGCSSAQLDALLASSNALVRWLGLAALEVLLQSDHTLIPRVHAIGSLTPIQKSGVLAWLLLRGRSNDTPLRALLLTELVSSLPRKIDSNSLRVLLDSMRNPLGRIYDSRPWILADVLAPAVDLGILSVDQVASAWVDELFDYWRWSKGIGTLLFKLDSEGEFIKQVAALIACCSGSHASKLTKRLADEISAIQRTVTRPLSPQRDWGSVHQEYEKALWIACIVRLIVSITPRPIVGKLESGLWNLHETAMSLVSRWRWRDGMGGTDSSLLQFSAQLNELFNDGVSTA